MWPRVVEVCLGLWLVLSPWIFGHWRDDAPLTATVMICGALVIAVSLASASRRFLRLHVLNLLVGAWLAGWAWFAGGYPNDDGYKNAILLGALLLLFAIIPGEADQPPRGWRRYYAGRAGDGTGDRPGKGAGEGGR